MFAFRLLFVGKDMDINEHERLSNITLEHTLKQENMRLCSCSTFHSRVGIKTRGSNQFASSLSTVLVKWAGLHENSPENYLTHNALFCNLAIKR